MTQIIDPHMLQELLELDNDPGLINELIAIFERNAGPRIKTMRDAFNCNDLKTLRREAHTLKSSAGSLGAVRVQKLSDKIEELADGGQSQGLGAMIDFLEQHMIEAIGALHEAAELVIRRGGAAA